VLAGRYLRGIGVEKNNQKALDWARLSAKQNHPFGLLRMGLFYKTKYMDDIDLRPNQSKAKEMLSKSVSGLKALAKKGDAEAMCNLGDLYQSRFGIGTTDVQAERQGLVRSKEWYRKSAENGHPEGQFKTGFEYTLKFGSRNTHILTVLFDFKTASTWFRKAAKQGHVDAQYQLGLLLYEAPEDEITIEPVEKQTFLGLSHISEEEHNIKGVTKKQPRSV